MTFDSIHCQWNKPLQLLIVPCPGGLISTFGCRRGKQIPAVVNWNKPYSTVTSYFTQLMTPSVHEQLKQGPGNQLVPCSLTRPFSSVQAGRERLVQWICSSVQAHLVRLLLSHSCPFAKALPRLSQQPLWVFLHSTLKPGKHVQLMSGFGLQVWWTSKTLPCLSLQPGNKFE